MAVMATWSEPLGWLIFWIFLIVATIYFLKWKKLSIVFLIGSIAMYIFTVFYVWDCFIYKKMYIFLMLLVSSVIFGLLGKYMKNYPIVTEHQKE